MALADESLFIYQHMLSRLEHLEADFSGLRSLDIELVADGPGEALSSISSVDDLPAVVVNSAQYFSYVHSLTLKHTGLWPHQPLF